MKKTLAIVLALAMVLCMIPAAFADTSKTITDKSYDITAYRWHEKAFGDELNSATKANSLTVKYAYEDEDKDVTGRFTEDKKMALVKVAGFDDALAEDTDEVYIDGKKLEVNTDAEYKSYIGYNKDQKSVVFPVELTKAGYTDTYLITVKSTVGGVAITETAKVTLKFENTSSYKNAKTATISKISGDKVDAYIVGSKIYLDFPGAAVDTDATVEITFKDNNNSLFKEVTWAGQTQYKDQGTDKSGAALYLEAEKKLSDSKIKYSVQDVTGNQLKEVVFPLETSNAIYETKKYTIVIRNNIVEADPKGIYFAESAKTIKVGESYSPVVYGIATKKALKADIMIGTDSENHISNVIDVDDNTVIGTQEGVAYITAKYATNDNKVYTASSMKIIVTAGEVVDETVTTAYTVTCRNLNVRKGPGTSYAKAGMIHRGDTVKVVSIANGWAKLDNGTYVASKYIAK